MKKCVDCGYEETENSEVVCKECGGVLELVNDEQAVQMQEETSNAKISEKKKIGFVVLAAVLVIAVIGGIIGTTMYFLNNNKSEYGDLVKNAAEKEKEAAQMSEEEMKKMLDSDESLVAVIDGVGITQEEYNLIYKLCYDSVASYSQIYGEGWYNTKIDDEVTFGEMIKNNTMANLKELIAIERIAEEEGVEVTDEELKEYIEDMKEQFGGEQIYNMYIEDYRTTDKAMETYFKRMLLANKLYEKIEAELLSEEKSDEEIAAEYLEGYVKVQHVLIQSTFENADENGDDPEALAKAKEVIAKLDGGADFDTLIEEYNEDPGMAPGQFYTFTTGEMAAEFEEASMNLQVGEYTKEPVRTSYGYHIIKKYELTADGEYFENYKMQVTQGEVQEEINNKMSELIEEKISVMKDVQKEAVIEAYIEEWLRELGVDTSAMPGDNKETSDDTEIEE